jgi:hypothetical protein
MLTSLVVAALLAASPKPPCYGRSERKSAAVREFEKAVPMPPKCLTKSGHPKMVTFTNAKTGKVTKQRSCRVDHICALACCGLDAPQNMQWQTYAESKKKDKTELQCKECGPKL